MLGRWRTLGGAFAVWTALGLFFGTQTYLASLYGTRPYSWAQALGLALVEWYGWGILFPAFTWLARRFPFERGRRRLAVTVHAPVLLGLAAVRVALESTALQRTQLAPLRQASVLFNGSLLTGGVVVGAAHALCYYRQSQHRRRRALRLESELAQAQLGLLRAQLRPHFLFNTLHSISELMHRDVAGAEEMLARLSDLLRLSLDGGERQEVTLHEELEIVQCYMDIQQVRFGARLRFRTAVAPETRAAAVPSMLLQPLVENAVQHGIGTRAEGGRVEVESRREGDSLTLVVRDDGPGIDAEATHGGIGLANTRSRLRQLYGDRQSLTSSPSGSGGEIRIRLPWRMSAEAER